jgi:excisionase family DNA binding protein
MRQKTQTEPIYSTSEVADLCHMSHSTLFRAIQRKQLKSFMTPGGHFRVRHSDLQEFAREMNIPLQDTSQSRSLKALIIEDNPVESRLLMRLLSKEPGWDVKAVHSGFDAGFALQSFRPDMVFLDIYLKDMDGRHVVRQIRQDPALKETTVIVVSGVRDPKEIEDIKKSGIDHYIPKPVSTKTFLHQIKALI